MRKLGLIAGGGALPDRLAARCDAVRRPFFMLRLSGFADPRLAERWPGTDVGLGQFGRCYDRLREEKCDVVCFAGHVSRPDFAALKLDAEGLRVLPGLITAARRGDDSLLRRVLHEFERNGFDVEGADEVDAGLTLGDGRLGALDLDTAHRADAEQALRVARTLGDLDIGQGAVVVHGLVLAVEAQEGTDAMLRRCADLPAELRGFEFARAGILAKAPKPIQDRRVDLPVIGPETIEAAARGGLAGVVAEAGGALIVDREAVIEAADRLGLFVVGLASSRPARA